ncbi:hypothetical protein KCP77_14040 [Salmonella enterica subsp. enterica]|nr:hypothetical protein KCP77_14040 [Salmonella enterica subsp. enterica]
MVNEGMKSAFPEIIFRGGVNRLEDGAKYRSSGSSICLFPSRNNIVFTLCSWLSTGSSSFDGRTYIMLRWCGLSRGGQWMAARRQYISGCRHPLFHLRGGVAGICQEQVLAFSGSYYFPLTGWKTVSSS